MLIHRTRRLCFIRRVISSHSMQVFNRVAFQQNEVRCSINWHVILSGILFCQTTICQRTTFACVCVSEIAPIDSRLLPTDLIRHRDKWRECPNFYKNIEFNHLNKLVLTKLEFVWGKLAYPSSGPVENIFFFFDIIRKLKSSTRFIRFRNVRKKNYYEMTTNHPWNLICTEQLGISYLLILCEVVQLKNSSKLKWWCWKVCKTVK